MAIKVNAFAAMIVPFEPGAHPDQGLPKPQPPGGAPPRPDHTLPGDLPHPENPIYYPLPPGVPVYPDNTLPGDQPRPDHTLPGDQPHPDNTLPEGSGDWKPVYIWGGGNVPMPTPPIVIPPAVEIDGKKVQPVCIWTPDNGWEVYAVVKPSGAVPTPSKRR